MTYGVVTVVGVVVVVDMQEVFSTRSRRSSRRSFLSWRLEETDIHIHQEKTTKPSEMPSMVPDQA